MPASSAAPPITVGFPDFWPEVYKVHGARFQAITKAAELANEMNAAAEKKATEPVQKIVLVLTRMTTIGMGDVLMLAANGSGPGAMKIARGMFESSTVAEYLRRNPTESENYIDFGRVLAWRRYEWLQKNSPEEAKRVRPAVASRLESEYKRVKGKFTDKKGRVRYQWSSKSIADLADSTGRREQYDLTYSLGSSIHHANAEGLLAFLDSHGDRLLLDAPPSMEWVTESLIAAHSFFLQTLDTLNDCVQLGFESKLKAAVADFHRVWQGRPTTSHHRGTVLTILGGVLGWLAAGSILRRLGITDFMHH